MAKSNNVPILYISGNILDKLPEELKKRLTEYFQTPCKLETLNRLITNNTWPCLSTIARHTFH